MFVEKIISTDANLSVRFQLKENKCSEKFDLQIVNSLSGIMWEDVLNLIPCNSKRP